MLKPDKSLYSLMVEYEQVRLGIWIAAVREIKNKIRQRFTRLWRTEQRQIMGRLLI